MKRVRILIIALGLAIAGAAVGLAPVRTVAAPTIQPGSSLEFGNSYCTLGWIFTSAGHVYASSASHCTTGVGQQVDLATGSLGSAIEPIGTVVYKGSALDYCLIELYTNVLPQVSAAMAGHPTIPTGVSTPSTAHLGDLLQFSGHGVGFDLLALTQQSRVGVFNFFDGQGNQYGVGPVTPGDSGGPVADLSDGGKALGIVDTVGLTLDLPTGANVGEGGVAIYALLQDAQAHGFSGLSLRTV